MFLCLRHTKELGYEFNDRNLVIFTICHELAHVCNITLQHPPEFWDWMKVILESAEEIGMYKPVDYNKLSQKYTRIQAGNIITNIVEPLSFDNIIDNVIKHF